MSSTKRIGGEAYQSIQTLNVMVEDWALKNADRIKRSCASCTYANREGPFKCSVYNVTPPLDVIMNGCPSYSDNDDIPF